MRGGRQLEEKVCRCGAVFTRPRYRKARYCSRRCTREAHAEQFAARDAGRRYTKGGYVTIQVALGHVSAARLRPGRGRRVPEHVVIVEETLGRCLRSGEVVHHVNGDKADNRRSNLLVCDATYHKWLHERMSHLYAQEHFGRPGQLVLVETGT